MQETQYRFGPFRLIPREQILLRDERPIALAPKAFELLVALAARHGRLVTRNELMQAIWPDSYVEEINLTVNISLLRKVLGEQADGRSWIATVPKRGYRFDGSVTEIGAEDAGQREAGPIVSAAEKPPGGRGEQRISPEQRGSPEQPGEKAAEAQSVGLRRAPRAVPGAVFLWFGIAAALSLLLVGFLWSRHGGVKARQRAGEAAGYSADAHELYERGRDALNRRSVQSVQQSLDFFRQAVEADPGYAAAWSGLADAWIVAGTYGTSFLAPKESMPRAREAAEKALRLNPGSPEAHTSLAYNRLTYDRDWAGAESEFRTALRLDPNYAPARHWYSHELMAEGRIEESHQQSEAGLAIDPANVLMNEHMAWHHLMAREYDRAIPQALKTIELNPNFVQARRVLALAYLYTGRYAEACAEFEKGVELSYNDPVARAYLARCYALSRRAAEARPIVDALVRASEERYISSAEIAAVYAALGETNETLRWLDQACDEHASALIYLNVDPVYDRMRDDPRFRQILRRVGFMPAP